MKTEREPPIVDLAVLGGGPVGLEAAARGRELGWKTSLFEAHEVAANVRRWGSVRLFSPLLLNAGPSGKRLLGDARMDLPDGADLMTGHDFRERYLLPLAEALGSAVELGARIVGITRRGWLKADELGTGARAAEPFRLLIERARCPAPGRPRDAARAIRSRRRAGRLRARRLALPPNPISSSWA